MKNVFEQEKVCSSDFMINDLGHLSRSEIKTWLDEIKSIDNIIGDVLEDNLDNIESNKNHLTEGVLEKCRELLKNAEISHTYDLKNLEVFHGYRFYSNPDNSRMRKVTNNPDAFYGIAKTNKFGVTHRHFQSDAFNLILEGEGIFTGDPLEKTMFRNFYHGTPLVPGTELEIELGMTHGHLVKKGREMWIFAYQHCGFGTGLSCEGDFHDISDYDTKQFGEDYE